MPICRRFYYAEAATVGDQEKHLSSKWYFNDKSNPGEKVSAFKDYLQGLYLI